jgi:hypothetical protein
MPRRLVWMAVGALLAVSLALRLVGIGWGIPHYDTALMPYTEYRHSYHLDEGKFLLGLAHMEPSVGNFDVSLHHWGTLQFYLIYGALLIGSVVGAVPAPWEGAFLAGDVDALPMMYLLGRLVSVFMGVAGTLVVIALGKALGGWRAGLGAGAAYVVTPLAVVGAHYLTNDITMSALLVGSVYAGVRAMQTGNGRWLFGAGLLLGLATSAKYSAAFGAFALVVAQMGFLVNERQSAVSTMDGSDSSGEGSGQSTLRRTIKMLTLPWLGAVIGFLLGEPYALLTPHILQEGLEQASKGNALDPSQGLGPPLEMLGWQVRNLAEFGITLPLALLAVGGVGVLALRGRQTTDDRRQGAESRGQKAEGSQAISITHHASRFTPRPSFVLRPSSIVITALLGLVVGLALNRVHMLRYTHVLLPLAAVCAGIGWAAISPVLLRWGVGAVALAVAGWITLGQLSMMAGAHPANSLLSWLQANLRPGDEVASLWPEYPLLDERKYQLVRIDPWRPDIAPGDRPDYIVLDDMALGPLGERLTSVVANEYNEVARFGSRPQVLGNSWDEGDTPHDWKYSHPTFRVYARK